MRVYKIVLLFRQKKSAVKKPKLSTAEIGLSYFKTCLNLIGRAVRGHSAEPYWPEPALQYLTGKQSDCG